MFLAKSQKKKKIHILAITAYENLTVSQFVHIEQIVQVAVFEVWKKIIFRVNLCQVNVRFKLV